VKRCARAGGGFAKLPVAESLPPQRGPLVRLTGLAGVRIGRRIKAHGRAFKWLGCNFILQNLNTIRVKKLKGSSAVSVWPCDASWISWEFCEQQSLPALHLLSASPATTLAVPLFLPMYSLIYHGI